MTAKNILSPISVRPCIKCGSFGRTANGKCKACKIVSNAAYNAANIEKRKALDAAWYAANRGKVKDSNAAWKAANPKKATVYSLAWGKKNPEARKIFDHNRNARKANNGGSLSKGIATKLFKLQNGMCPCCKQSLGANYHIDHIVPLALGGSNSDDNAQLLRATCNLQKNKKHPIDFMQQRGFLL